MSLVDLLAHEWILHGLGMRVTTVDGCIQVTGIQAHMDFAIYLPGMGKVTDPASGLNNGDNDALLQNSIMFFLYQGVHGDWILLQGMDNRACIIA